LFFYSVQPTNISVLSDENIDVKVHHLMSLLSMIPELEIICLDSCQCFDANKQNIIQRIEEEKNSDIRNILKADLEFLDSIQVEMSTARQFLFSLRIKDRKEGQIFQQINRSSKLIAEHGFDVRQLKKEDIKRMLAIYFEVSMNGEEIELIEGEKYLEAAVNEKN
jgi:DNA polymerase III delta prime subunit